MFKKCIAVFLGVSFAVSSFSTVFAKDGGIDGMQLEKSGAAQAAVMEAAGTAVTNIEITEIPEEIKTTEAIEIPENIAAASTERPIPQAELASITNINEPAVDTAVLAESNSSWSSNDSFSTSSQNGSWGEVWQAEIYNSQTGMYSDAAGVYNGGFANDGWTWNNALVKGDALTVAQAELALTQHPVRAFVAPEAGTVKIESTEIAHNTDSKRIILRIKKNDTEIWSAEVNWYGSTLLPEITVDVAVGDKIRFEVIQLEERTWGYDINWTNTVSYTGGTVTEPTPKPTPDPTPIPDDESRRVYRASDSYSTAQNGDNIWKWQSYVVSTGEYTDLTNATESQLDFGPYDPVTGAYTYDTSWTAGTDWRWVSVGKKSMRISVDPGDPTSEETDGMMRVMRDHAVRTFTAPKRGTVLIEADGGILNAHNTVNGTHVKIMRLPADGSDAVQIWPVDEDYINIVGECVFEPIEIELEKGDRLTFENVFKYVQGGCSPWDTVIDWDPVIEYKTVYPVFISAEPSDGANDVPLNFRHTVTFDKELEKLSVEDIEVYTLNADGGKEECGAVCSFAETNGKTVSFEFEGLEPYTSYVAVINGILISGMEAENECLQELAFTTGQAINIGAMSYSGGIVSCMINNPYDEPLAATLMAAVCRGTEEKYTIEKMYFVRREDIGANDILEMTVPDIGTGYFIKAVVLENIESARAYAIPAILKGGA